MFKRIDKPGDIDTSAMSEYEKAITYNWYIFASDPGLGVRIGEVLRELDELNELAKSGNSDIAFRELRALIPGIDETCNIVFPIKVEYPERFEVGEHTFINNNFENCSSGYIKIGKNCFIGPHARFYTPNHHPSDVELRHAGWQYDAPITVGDDVWFGGSVVVCPGVTIGSNVVVGAGAVVTKDVPDNVVVGGNPARVLKELKAAAV
jgi:maltose O-acetyltransferase